MKYIIGTIFSAFLISNIYILHMNRKASVKRRAFRWWMASFGTFLIVFTAFTIEDLVLMVFIVPVVAWVVFMSLIFTKFCDWCGKLVQNNLPFTDKDHCPRCGSSIS
jgi:hypothetical protein